MDWRNQNHWTLDTLALQPAKFFFSKNKMGPTARRWASAFWPRWGLSTQGILQLKPCGWADAGRGTVQILNNGQNPSTVLSDADIGLKAPAVAGLGGGGGAAGPGEGTRSPAGGWGALVRMGDQLSTNQNKNKLPGASMGSGADRLFPPPTWLLFHICVKGMLLKKGK